MARPLVWIDEIVGVVQGAALTFEDLLASASVSLDTITVARLIVDITATPESLIAAVQGVQRIDMGVAVVTNNAFSAGVSAVPDPRVAADAPARGWLWRGSMTQVYSNVDGSEKETMHLYPSRQYDIRTMRKVDQGRLIFIAAKTAIQGTAHDVDLSGLIRTLCMS